MRKVSIKDLAARTGLSQATVSLSLRNHPRISDDTKSRVLKAAKELGYVYNRQAANLRMSRTRTIGVCLNTIENPVIARIFTGLLHFFQSQEWMVVFGDSEDQPQKQAAFLSAALENNMAGLIVVPAVGTRLEDLQAIARFVPLVVALRELRQSTLDQVRIDYEGGVHAAIDHLAALGHRKIGFIGAGLATETSRIGLAAYRARMRHHGLDAPPALTQACPTSRQAGFHAMTALIEKGADMTAVLCFSDLIASGAMRAMAEAGLVAGRDISVVGFDDLDEASYLQPPLTTVRIDQPFLGEAAGRLLLNRISDAGMPRQVVTIPSQLVLRATSRTLEA
ncbi:LacI family DNA-binding transcriptional regulator [Ciceribacter sp. sgz301302]